MAGLQGLPFEPVEADLAAHRGPVPPFPMTATVLGVRGGTVEGDLPLPAVVDKVDVAELVPGVQMEASEVEGQLLAPLARAGHHSGLSLAREGDLYSPAGGQVDRRWGCRGTAGRTLPAVGDQPR